MAWATQQINSTLKEIFYKYVLICFERGNKMIRFILINILFALAYLWGLENNRLICGAMLFIGPFIELFLYWALIERKETQCQE